LSDESHKETTDTKRLETQIENLRCAIIALIIAVALLVGDVIIQSLQQYSAWSFASFGLLAIAAFAVLLICSYSYATDRM
jgi:hypothetical protein